MQIVGRVMEIKNCGHRVLHCLVLAAGLLLLVAGIFVIIFYPKLVETRIRERSKLDPGTDFFNNWVNPPYNAKSFIYVYSIANPDEILNGSKPHVISFGPYVFDIKLWNDVLSIRNGVIKYNTYTRFSFNKTDSCAECFPEFKVWIPNIVYQKFVEAASNPSMKAAQTALISQKPFLEVSVEDMLFKGYKDPFLDKVCSIPFMNFICDSVLDLPEKIAFLNEKNMTHKGTFEASTGEYDNGRSLGLLLSWNGVNTVPKHWWNDDYATIINGTDGSLYSPYIKKTDRLYIFVPDICRSIYFIFDRESEYKGVPTYVFKVPEEVFDFTLSSNKGFCFNSGKAFFSNKEECLPNGLIDLSRCQKGEPPIVFSLPNFLFADQIVKESIIGLNQSSMERDGIIIEIEPRTATVVRVYKRSQVNIALWKGNDITIGADLSRMRSSIIPLFSCFEVFEIDEVSLNKLLSKLINVDRIVSVLSIFFICFGTIITLVASFLLTIKSRKVSFYLENRGESTMVYPIPDQKPFSLGSTDRRCF